MKRKIIWVTIGVVVVALVAFALTRLQKRPAQTDSAAHSAEHPPAPISSAATKSVPAHYQTEPSASSLAPTLAPEKFTGKAQEAYRVVREAPQLICEAHIRAMHVDERKTK